MTANFLAVIILLFDGLLQSNEYVLFSFFGLNLILTEQPAQSEVELLVGLNLSDLLQFLTRELTLLVEGLPNLTSVSACDFL